MVGDDDLGSRDHRSPVNSAPSLPDGDRPYGQELNHQYEHHTNDDDMRFSNNKPTSDRHSGHHSQHDDDEIESQGAEQANRSDPGTPSREQSIHDSDSSYGGQTSDNDPDPREHEQGNREDSGRFVLLTLSVQRLNDVHPQDLELRFYDNWPLPDQDDVVIINFYAEHAGSGNVGQSVASESSNKDDGSRKSDSDSMVSVPSLSSKQGGMKRGRHMGDTSARERHAKRRCLSGDAMAADEQNGPRFGKIYPMLESIMSFFLLVLI